MPSEPLGSEGPRLPSNVLGPGHFSQAIAPLHIHFTHANVFIRVVDKWPYEGWRWLLNQPRMSTLYSKRTVANRVHGLAFRVHPIQAMHEQRNLPPGASCGLLR